MTGFYTCTYGSPSIYPKLLSEWWRNLENEVKSSNWHFLDFWLPQLLW